MTQKNLKMYAIVFGLLFAISQTVWVIVVGIGSGQALIDAMASFHFVTTTLSVTAFSAGTAIVGISYAFLAGLVVGGVYAWLWNWTIKTFGGKK